MLHITEKQIILVLIYFNVEIHTFAFMGYFLENTKEFTSYCDPLLMPTFRESYRSLFRTRSVTNIWRQ